MSVDKLAVIVITDGLRRDSIEAQSTPALDVLRGESVWLRRHRSAAPSVTRVCSATIATGCYPLRHELAGNKLCLLDHGKLRLLDVGVPSFFSLCRELRGHVLGVPTLAQRTEAAGGLRRGSCRPEGLRRRLSMLKASPSGADKIQSFPDLRQILLYAALGGIVLAALFAPWLTDVSPLDQDLMNLDQPFSPAHPLGTDSLGRDILARLVYGARTTLEISLGGTFIAFFIGAGIGLTALSMGRFAAGVFFAFIDLVRALPSTLMALLVIVGLGSGQWQLMAATGIAFSPLVAYVARSVYQREASREYVLAARSFGGSRMHILKLHLLPNIMGALITQLGIVLPRCIVTESVLSFLGLGSSPDEPTWGRMIADAAPMMERAPHEVIVPLCALVLLTFSLSLLANEWRERLDPIRRLERC